MNKREEADKGSVRSCRHSPAVREKKNKPANELQELLILMTFMTVL